MVARRENEMNRVTIYIGYEARINALISDMASLALYRIHKESVIVLADLILKLR